MPMPASASGSRGHCAASGKTWVMAGNGVATGAPKRAAMRPASVRAAATLICWPSTARTAISKPSKAPGRRNPGAPAASGPRAAATASGSQARSNSSRSRATTAPITGASDGASRTTAVGFAIARDPHRPQIAAVLDRLDRGDRTSGQKVELRPPRVRRPVGEFERNRLVGGRIAGLGLAPCSRRYAVSRGKQGMQPARTAEAGGIGDIGDRQRGVAQQPTRQQQLLRLRVLHRRHAELVGEHAAQMALADAEPRGQFG
ncbi:conserved hypothetical protein [Ricinus communis]|uniref:Uncharacterized protein n=1 Tax=Ricinus communis TaxID=3988 RepID=B9TLW9_RICCO|nr:conserved hypothetical protein [Ricinus communis]